MIGDTVKVIVDRPLGSCHPEYKELYYPINYGYIEGVIASDGEEQDACILGVNLAVSEFTGKVIAIIQRKDDVEEKWVVAPENSFFSEEEIRRQVQFQEQYFDSEIKMEKPGNQKVYKILKIILWSFIGVFLGSSIYQYYDYKKHSGSYEMQSAPWYLSIAIRGIFTFLIVMILFIVMRYMKRK